MADGPYAVSHEPRHTPFHDRVLDYLLPSQERTIPFLIEPNIHVQRNVIQSSTRLRQPQPPNGNEPMGLVMGIVCNTLLGPFGASDGP